MTEFWLWRVDDFVVSACSRTEISNLYEGIEMSEDEGKENHEESWKLKHKLNRESDCWK